MRHTCSCGHKLRESCSAVWCINANHAALERGRNFVCNQARREQVSAPLPTPTACSALMVPIGPREQDASHLQPGNRFCALEISVTRRQNVTGFFHVSSRLLVIAADFWHNKEKKGFSSAAFRFKYKGDSVEPPEHPSQSPGMYQKSYTRTGLLLSGGEVGVGGATSSK